MPKYLISLKINKLNKGLASSVGKVEEITVSELKMQKLLGLWEHIKKEGK